MDWHMILSHPPVFLSDKVSKNIISFYNLLRETHADIDYKITLFWVESSMTLEKKYVDQLKSVREQKSLSESEYEIEHRNFFTSFGKTLPPHLCLGADFVEKEGSRQCSVEGVGFGLELDGFPDSFLNREARFDLREGLIVELGSP